MYVRTHMAMYWVRAWNLEYSVLMPCYVTMYCQAAVWHFVVMSSWLGEARKLAVYGEMLVMLATVGAHLVECTRSALMGRSTLLRC